MTKLLIASKNRGKFKEFVELLAGLPFELTSLDREGIDEEVEETGATFAENAILKARFYARLSGLLTLADDSGLEVDALGGEPGVRSARYAGPGATDEDRVRLLLSNLADVPKERRTARFRSVIAVADAEENVKTADGTVEGFILFESRGSHGFGYDPVFFVPELGKTLSEVPIEVKNRISHRARAATGARSILVDFAQKGD